MWVTVRAALGHYIIKGTVDEMLIKWKFSRKLQQQGMSSGSTNIKFAINPMQKWRLKPKSVRLKQCVQTETSTVFIFHKAKELCQIPTFICFLQGAWANSPHWTSPMFCLPLPLSSILSSHCRRCSVFHRIEPEKLHVFGSGWAPATFFLLFLRNSIGASCAKWTPPSPPCFVSFLYVISSGEKLLYSASVWPGHLSEGQFLFWVGRIGFLWASPLLSLQLHLARGSNPQSKKLIRTIMSASLLTG